MRVSMPLHLRGQQVAVEDEMHNIARSPQCDHEVKLVTTLRETRSRVALERLEDEILDLAVPNEFGRCLLPVIQAQQLDAREVLLSAMQIDPHERTAIHAVDAVLYNPTRTPTRLLAAIEQGKSAREAQT